MSDVAAMTEREALPTPPPEQGNDDKGALLVRLDELLEQYLITLDSYEQAQRELTATLSSVRGLRRMPGSMIASSHVLTPCVGSRVIFH